MSITGPSITGLCARERDGGERESAAFLFLIGGYFPIFVRLMISSAQGVPDPSSDDLGLFNLSSQTRRSQTARGQLATRSARWTVRVPDLSNQTARDNISSRSDQF
ncbi:hypothetical protein F2Q68_00017515 [Brassica cretica]|uniref:Uncharacterized protein n=2 Tax=Brassica cretica TaxID=69181 RepID=A0A8S9HNA0_BRACR|nr:hypothetical protein F2Q68_00017515 [Brassica cretica]KAF3611434.1 hypothetical protein DY000_02050314 [Brassica cretica]